MKTLIALAVAGALAPVAAPAGTITGVVKAQGKAGTESETTGGKYESRQFKFVERVNYAELHDFVVYVEGKIGAGAAAPEKPAQILTQRISQQGAVFSPHVLPVLVGTTVEWPNQDNILHNVFSFSEAKPFDLGLYKAPVVKQVRFDKPGRVDVFCSIHTRMSCIVLVLENPFFAVANDRGAYAITNVPPGTYRLKAWHERLPSQSVEAVVPPSGEVKVNFTLGITGLPAS